MPWDRKRLLGYVETIQLLLGVTDKCAYKLLSVIIFIYRKLCLLIKTGRVNLYAAIHYHRDDGCHNANAKSDDEDWNISPKLLLLLWLKRVTINYILKIKECKIKENTQFNCVSLAGR